MNLTRTMPEPPKLEKLMDAARLGWWQADINQQVYIFSDLIVQLLKLNGTALPFREFEQLIHPDYHARAIERFASIPSCEHYEDSFPLFISGRVVWVRSTLVEKTTQPDGNLLISGTLQIIRKTEDDKEALNGTTSDSPIPGQEDGIYHSLLSFLHTEDITPIIQAALKNILGKFHGGRVALFEYDHQKQTQSCLYEVIDGTSRQTKTFTRDFPYQTVSWWSQRILSGLPILLNDLEELPEDTSPEKTALQRVKAQSIMAIPLLARDHVWGFISVDRSSPMPWDKEDFQHFSSIANLISICMQFHSLQGKMRQEQQHLNNLYKYMPTGHVRLKMLFGEDGEPDDFICLDANQAAARILGRDLLDKIGKKTGLTNRAVRILQNKEIRGILNTTRHVTKDFRLGEEGKYCQGVFFSPGRDELAVLLTDTTDSVHIRKNLEQSEAKLRNIYMQLPVGIELYDKQGVLVDMNDKELEIFGLHKKEDALGLVLFDNPNIPDEVKEKLRRHESVEFTLNYDFSLVGEWYDTNKRATKIYLVTIATPLFDSQGEFTHYLFINIDNTETTTAHQRIEEFEEMFSLIGQYAQVGYAHFDAFTRDGDALDSWFENLGEKPGTPLNQIVGVLNHVPAEDKVPIREFFQQVKKGEARHLRHDVRVIHDDGNLKWTRLNIMVRDFHPEVQRIGMVCVNYDITTLKETERMLIEAKDKAELSDRLKSAFLANMSHEIRTPLNAIVGFSNLLLEAEDSKERHHYMSIVQENNELLLKLISDILDISKIEAGTLEFTIEEVDIHLLCKELIQVLSLKAPKHITLQFDESAPHIYLQGDKNRILQVLSNFLTNAMKFTQNGSITLCYEMTADQTVKFLVNDTGIGISPEKQDSIFNRFVKLNTFAQGTGLGLSICKSLVEQMGGEIGVDSSEGDGSCFWFTHPYDPAFHAGEGAVAAAPGAVQEQKSTTEASGDEKPLILIAEDIDSNFLLINALLKKDYRVIRAVNGAEAVKMYERETPDFILMDMKMPVMDGLEATAKIREMDKQIPIVAVTAFAFDTDKQNALDAGCNGFVTKPISSAVLKETINKWLR